MGLCASKQAPEGVPQERVTLPPVNIPKKESNAHNEEFGHLLKRVPLLSALTDNERAILGGRVKEVAFTPGSDIVVQGEKGDKFYFIMSGVCQVIHTDDAKMETIVADLGEGDYFGENALKVGERRGATIRAKEVTVVLSLARDDFQELVGEGHGAIANLKPMHRKAVHGGPVRALSKLASEKDLSKTLDELLELEKSVKKVMIFKTMDDEQRSNVISSMWCETIKAGTSVITQGEFGDAFYVVKSGHFEIFVKSEGSEESVKVNEATTGGTFGDLALMYNAPRAATVTATVDSEVWAVDRFTFRRNLMIVSEKKIEEYEGFLREVPVISGLLRAERFQVAETLEEKLFADGETIVSQGDEGDGMYIIRKGTVAVMKDGQSLPDIESGRFFGERALAKNAPRAATCTAKGTVVCLFLNRAAFELLLGPLHSMMAEIDWDSKASSPVEAEGNQKNLKEQLSKASPIVDEIPRDRLDVVGTLGKGSFGLVQLMQDRETGQHYALKQISKAQIVALGQQEHVLSERDVMRICDHPLIIKLFATYKDEENLYFLLEVCMGGELFTYLRDMVCFSESTARFYAACVILSFEYLQERDIVYRDLKPENLLIDPTGFLKIVDFGFAKCVQDRTYTLCGTPDYLCPEVIAGSGHGKGVDWWTLGVLIYEMIAGVPPFYDDDQMRTYAKIMNGQIEFPANFSPEATDLIQRLLHPKPTRRLGVLKAGPAQIKEHPWFEGFDWEGLYAKSITSPYVPEKLDLSNFPEDFDDSEDEDYGEYYDDGSGWDADW